MPAILQYLTRALAAQKNVFAHVVVGNTAAHTVDTWARDIKLASGAGIDAFVLNIAYPDTNIPQQVENAFKAAENGTDFKLFFSFDYLVCCNLDPACIQSFTDFHNREVVPHGLQQLTTRTLSSVI